VRINRRRRGKIRATAIHVDATCAIRLGRQLVRRLLEKSSTGRALASRKEVNVSRITRILVPTDFSETSDAALTYARQLADALGASLHLVHVFDDPYGDALVAEVSASVYESMRASAITAARRELMRRLPAEDRQRFRGSSAMITGVAANAIVQYAADHSMDLIVMGTHGRTGFAHLLIGSVAEQVVRTAHSPVLTVRTEAVEHELKEEAVSAVA
jgi:nucleotide-binding universal stress UspA family protein